MISAYAFDADSLGNRPWLRLQATIPIRLYGGRDHCDKTFAMQSTGSDSSEAPKEEKGSFLTTLLDRFKSRVVPPIVISWILWNYSYLIILFSSGDPVTRLRAAYDEAFGSLGALIWFGIALPVASGFLFIVGHPILDRWAAIYDRGQAALLKANRFSESLGSYATPEKYEALLVALDRSYPPGMTGDGFTRHLVNPFVPGIGKADAINQVQQAILHDLSGLDGSVSIEALRMRIGESAFSGSFDEAITACVVQGLIAVGASDNGKVTQLTQLGMAVSYLRALQFATGIPIAFSHESKPKLSGAIGRFIWAIKWAFRL